jgi:transposase InsO family protein
MEDRRCKLGLRARWELVQLVEQGSTLRAAAAALNVAPATAHRWWHRWRQATDAERASRSCLRARPPAPKSCPWALSAEQERVVLDARRRTGLGPMRLAAITGRHRSTVWKVLARHGCSGRPRRPRQTFRRYEWSEPGALLHIDAMMVPRFAVEGHRIHGDRSRRTRGLGNHVVIAVIDDHTRLAYCELHASENAEAVSVTLHRAAKWMREQGCGPTQAVMSDNAKCYATSHAFAGTLAELDARHILTPPFTPRWNGKMKRFFQTLDREWAAPVWPNHHARNRALRSYLRYYNRFRPHSAAGGHAPITRVLHLREQDT